MRTFAKLALLLLAATLLPAMAATAQSTARDNDVLYQVSTIQALLNGHYEGSVRFSELADHGDFGIGTFDDLDGEMIAFDGHFHQVDYTGKVNRVGAGWTTPFAVVTHFEPDMELRFKYVKDFKDLERRLEKELPGLNLFYAIRIDGYFQYVKTRSVPAQQPPYPPLAEVAKHQAVFEIQETIGTVVGFYTPEFGGKVNVPGFHMHYLDQNAQRGGHILDLSASEVVVQVDQTPKLFLNLPLSTANAKMIDRTDELDGIEK